MISPGDDHRVDAIKTAKNYLENKSKYVIIVFVADIMPGTIRGEVSSRTETYAKELMESVTHVGVYNLDSVEIHLN